MKALLLIAHGSHNQISNDEIFQLAESLKYLELDFDLVNCAFLELVQPDIASRISYLADEGATEITVLPYFLAQGNHIVRDIPEIISKSRKQFPDTPINTLPHIGKATNMLNLLVEHINTG